MPDKIADITTLSDLMPPSAQHLFLASGRELFRRIGMEVVRGVVLDVLTGKNLRDSTEPLTRSRLVALNLATANLFLQGSALSESFVDRLPHLASEMLMAQRLNKADRWFAEWVLGLTDKAFQNVLRDDPNSLGQYRDRYIKICRESAARHTQEYGELSGILEIGGEVRARIDWLLMSYLFNTIGAQTLAIRGSEKSAYGKLFERLILGSLLYILGFQHVTPPPRQFERVFWLSSRGERRESDATLLYDAGQGVRFDIGFIGRGNPEISLDKVARFEREIILGRSRWYMATIILVDRIGAHSRIEQLAREVDGTIIQMSAGYWPQQVAQVLNRTLGFEHELVCMEQNDIRGFLERRLSEAPLEDFIGLLEDNKV